MQLAKELVTLYHSAEEAGAAAAEFDRIFRQKGLPDEIPEITLKAEDSEAGGIQLVHLLVLSGMAKTNSEARRLIEQGAVDLNGETIREVWFVVPSDRSHLLKVGKKGFFRIWPGGYETTKSKQVEGLSR
jgi:tyrosyl-tRNA synthetase